MEAVNKIQLLQTLEDQVEAHLQTAVGTFQNLPENKLLLPAANGGWSVAQCLEHLNYYGNFYLPHVQNGLKKAESVPDSVTFKSTWLGSYFTKMMNPTTGKKKMKAFKEYNPPENLDARQTVAEFIRQQEMLLTLLRKSHSADLNKIRIPVSIAKFIKLKAGDVFQFLIAHNERHLQQAKRNL